MSDTTDALLFVAQNLDEAALMRKHLLGYNRCLWLFVSRCSDGTYQVCASNEHGGRLSHPVTIALREECQRFCNEQLTPIELNDEDYEEVDEFMDSMAS
jgi:hypothetical protein